MRISIIIFAVCVGLLAYTDEGKGMYHVPPLHSENVLLLLSQRDFEYVKDSSKNFDRVNVGFEKYNGSSRSMHFYIDMAFNCEYDKVWLLKSQDELKNVFHNVLDGYQFQTEYSLNNIFFRQINVGFDNATSISYDWLVKQVFWSEHKNGLYSIKRTDETFYKHLYIILPQAQLNIEDVKVCPKQNEVFFLSNDSIWFTPIETNSTATLLFSREQYSGWIYKFSIDYATDILYWVAGDESNHDTLYSVDILNTARPFNEADIKKIEKIDVIEDTVSNLVAFNNTLYWITNNNGKKLYYKNGNKEAVKVGDLAPDSIITFIAAKCPCAWNCGKQERKKYDSKK